MISLAVIPGDGVGQEVIPAGLRVLQSVTSVDAELLPWGADHYHRTGAMMPPDALEVLDAFDGIYLGAVGWPSVPDHISLWGLLLPIRKAFELFVNVRPVKLLPGIRGPLADRGPDDIDMLFLRENTEGEYSGTGGRVHVGTPMELAVEAPIFTRAAIERVARYAFERAMERSQTLISVTKSNASRYLYVLWDEVIDSVGEEFPRVSVLRMHVDAMAARMVLTPQSIDVVVASNLFGDILTDLGAALQGSIGLAASANLDPSGRHPSLFEPVHGSAPDIAGQGRANPIGAIWTGALLLRHLGLEPEAQRVEAAIAAVLAGGGPRTADLGGRARTEDVADAVIEALHTAPPQPPTQIGGMHAG